MFYHAIIRLYQITISDRTSLVFVHGLGGHCYNTWSKNGVFWPRDLLGEDVQNVRVIVFGYDSDVVKFFGRVSRNQIRDHARTLVADLRKSPITQPNSGSLCKEPGRGLRKPMALSVCRRQSASLGITVSTRKRLKERKKKEMDGLC